MNHRVSSSNKTLYIIILVLVVVLIATFSFIGWEKYKVSRTEKENVLRAEGYELAIVQMMNEASKCTPVPMTYNNVTISMFALDCNNLAEVASAVLQQRAQAQQTAPVTNTTNQ